MVELRGASRTTGFRLDPAECDVALTHLPPVNDLTVPACRMDMIRGLDPPQESSEFGMAGVPETHYRRQTANEKDEGFA